MSALLSPPLTPTDTFIQPTSSITDRALASFTHLLGSANTSALASLPSGTPRLHLTSLRSGENDYLIATFSLPSPNAHSTIPNADTGSLTNANKRWIENKVSFFTAAPDDTTIARVERQRCRGSSKDIEAVAGLNDVVENRWGAVIRHILHEAYASYLSVHDKSKSWMRAEDRRVRRGSTSGHTGDSQAETNILGNWEVIGGDDKGSSGGRAGFGMSVEIQCDMQKPW